MGHKLRELCSDFPIHITARGNNRERFPLPLSEIWDVLTDYLYVTHKLFGLETAAFVLMPNHFHLIARDPDLQMSTAMAWFMRETSREIGRLSMRINKIWGGPYHSSVIRNPLYYLHAYKYVYRNPVKAGLCSTVLDYPHSTLRVLLGFRHGIVPNVNDDTLMEDVEGTLNWLNLPYLPDEEESIRRAFRKKEFKLRQDPSSRNSLLLENWESVPDRLRITGSKAVQYCPVEL